MLSIRFAHGPTSMGATIGDRRCPDGPAGVEIVSVGSANGVEARVDTVRHAWDQVALQMLRRDPASLVQFVGWQIESRVRRDYGGVEDEVEQPVVAVASRDVVNDQETAHG